MAGNYMYSNQSIDGKMKRVYINPNFNRQNNLQTSNKMYVNPNFPQVTPNMYNVQQPREPANSARIHVNPNFIRNANAQHPVVTNDVPYNVPVCAPTTSSYKELKTVTEASQGLTMNVAKSRYCLVRQRENLVKPLITNTTQPVKSTVRVSKYKSVSLNVVKNIIASEKPPKSTVETAHAKNVILKTVCNDSSRYKFVKPSISNAINNSERRPTKFARRSSLLNKSISRSPKRNTKLKKNNIPCPLFKKYGTCLRKLKGRCEYLHDKKHVSICHKFLKGVCHDANCLLSHDLTDKKMPTCHFYLQGTCTKENCSYLHVKLNEKTKTCQDFLKGYCEKGDKCLFRHVRVSQASKSSKILLRKQLPYSTGSKSNHVENVKSRKKSFIVRDETQGQRKFNKVDMHQMEQRYFKEMLDDKSSSEKTSSIKPNRIKLGTLPSFIQL